uniref:Uncharacterized protein MANES_12G087300 n=1 Tax=Rhizophora mucronata TaxID=61149 RepID=A0A2P2PU09_RHIMU
MFLTLCQPFLQDFSTILTPFLKKILSSLALSLICLSNPPMFSVSREIETETQKNLEKNLEKNRENLEIYIDRERERQRKLEQARFFLLRSLPA